MKAVVVTGLNEFNVEEITLDSPKAEEVRVKVKAAGLCHSDLSMINGAIPAPFPLVLGHEGAGIITEVGEKVTRLKVGDHVVFTLQPVCGTCDPCMHGDHICCDFVTTEQLLSATMPDGTTRHSRPNGDKLYTHVALACLAEETVVHENSAVKIDADIPFASASLSGCGVITGAGGAIFGGDIRTGDKVVVLGCGGVGLSAIQGASIAGATTIIAVDIADNKLEMAKEFGATHTINGGQESVPERVTEITGRGADTALECVGIPALMQQGYDSLRSGGTLVIIGIAPMGQQLPMDAFSLPFSGRVVKGGKYGNHNPVLDIPMLLDLYKQGKLDIDSMVSKTYSIDQIHEAFEDMEKNVNARGVIVFD